MVTSCDDADFLEGEDVERSEKIKRPSNKSGASEGTTKPEANEQPVPYDEAVTEVAGSRQREGRRQTAASRCARRTSRAELRQNTATARWQNSRRRSASHPAPWNVIAASTRHGTEWELRPRGRFLIRCCANWRTIPNREQIVKENPKITKREAQKLRRDTRRETTRKQNKSRQWEAERNRALVTPSCSLANDVKRTAERE